MSTKVRDVMTTDPFTIDPEAPLETAVDVMRTERDVLRALSRERGALPVSPEGFLW